VYERHRAFTLIFTSNDDGRGAATSLIPCSSTWTGSGGGLSSTSNIFWGIRADTDLPGNPGLGPAPLRAVPWRQATNALELTAGAV